VAAAGGLNGLSFGKLEIREKGVVCCFFSVSESIRLLGVWHRRAGWDSNPNENGDITRNPPFQARIKIDSIMKLSLANNNLKSPVSTRTVYSS
jgi:hypothetical protein